MTKVIVHLKIGKPLVYYSDSIPDYLRNWWRDAGLGGPDGSVSFGRFVSRRDNINFVEIFD